MNVQPGEKQLKIYEGVLALARRGENLYLVKVQDIATAAGLGKGTLYEYFQSKEDILAGTMLWCVQNLIGSLEQAAAAPGDFREKLRRMQGLLADEMQRQGASYRLIMNAFTPTALPGLAQKYGEQLAAGRRRLEEMERSLLAQGRAEGLIGPACGDAYCRYVLETSLFSVVAAQGAPCFPGGTPSREHALAMALKALA